MLASNAQVYTNVPTSFKLRSAQLARSVVGALCGDWGPRLGPSHEPLAPGQPLVHAALGARRGRLQEFSRAQAQGRRPHRQGSRRSHRGAWMSCCRRTCCPGSSARSGCPSTQPQAYAPPGRMPTAGSCGGAATSTQGVCDSWLVCPRTRLASACCPAAWWRSPRASRATKTA